MPPSERTLQDFKIGDRVRLVAPFRCQGDHEEFDENLDATLRAQATSHKVPGGEVLGTVRRLINDYVEVYFDTHGTLLTDPNVLDFEHIPATDDEVAQAIQSINEALGGFHG